MAGAQRLLERDRLVVLAALVVVVGLAWFWIVSMSRDMYGPMSGSSAWMMTPVWDARHLALLFAMWAAMMAGMMLPSAMPAILLYMAIARRSAGARAQVQTQGFAAGYLVAWTGFAALAVLVQRLLTSVLVLSPMMELPSRRASSVVLLLAGAYQLTPFKRACLAACQSPAMFIVNRWKPGATGAWRMGFEHGLYCLGCCWALMLLLFAGGVMHLGTIVMLSAFVLLEKLLPLGERTLWFTRLTGTALIALAAFMTFK